MTRRRLWVGVGESITDFPLYNGESIDGATAVFEVWTVLGKATASLNIAYDVYVGVLRTTIDCQDNGLLDHLETLVEKCELFALLPAPIWPLVFDICHDDDNSDLCYLVDHLGNYIVDGMGNKIIVPCPPTASVGLTTEDGVLLTTEGGDTLTTEG